MKKILIISSSLRTNGNSNMLSNTLGKGARSAGHQVEQVFLSEKSIRFCTGCLACQTTGKCPLKDDMHEILESMKSSDVLVFATPIYFYEMSGLMKTCLDRTNPLYETNYKFQDIYLVASAAEAVESAMNGAIHGLNGWIECFPGTSLKGVLYGIGLTNVGDIKQHTALLQEAYDLGARI